MTLPSISFNKQDRPEFVKELHRRVNTYFKEKKISRYANLNMKLKTAVMLTLYITPFFLLISGLITGFWAILAMYVVMAGGMSGIGLCVMHDANHGAYSRNKSINKIMGFMINLVGGYHKNWIIEHNYLHHTYTNVEGMDEDIEVPLMRFSPNQDLKFINRFQAFYAPVLYWFMTVNWFVSDFFSIFRFSKKKLLKKQDLTISKGIFWVFFHKVWYVSIFFILPLVLIDAPWWQILIGYFVMHGLTGLTLALIFTCAHVVEEVDFYEAADDGSVENNWAIHQMMTTTNFANGAKLFSWMVGGLNYQIEHHLFPNICHVHYPKLSGIVKELAEEYGVPYHHHKTFFSALRSHFLMLHKLGTGQYDLELQQKALRMS